MQHLARSRQPGNRAISYHAPVRLAIIIFVLTLAVQAQAQWDIEDSHTTASLRGIDNVKNSGSPSAPTAPTSPATTAATGHPSNPPKENPPMPTKIGTPSRSPSS